MITGLENPFFVAGILWKEKSELSWKECQDLAHWIVTGEQKEQDNG